MTMNGLELRSLVKENGELELSLRSAPVPEPGPDEVVVQVRAAPINPSDLGLLLGPADLATARATGRGESAVVTLTIPEALRGVVAQRVGESMPIGNEGAGTVVRAGSSPAAQALVGKTVALWGGGMHATHRVARAADALVLPDGTSAADGASCFVNPLTVLAMIETMRREEHTAIVHTAAASNLGQMLVKLCRAERIGLVNVVRRPEQEKVLRDLGAEHVVSSASPTFRRDLVAAIGATGATLGFDAVGGGPLAGQLLEAMEIVAASKTKGYQRYGSSVHKQVYVYGALDLRPTEVPRSVGMTWGLGGFLLPNFLQTITPAELERMKQRVVSDLHSTFASHYSHSISLTDVLDLERMKQYAARATGEKFLIDPAA